MPKKNQGFVNRHLRAADGFLRDLPGFGPFRLDFDQQVLYKNGKEVKLRAIAFAVLRCLYEHRNKGILYKQLEDCAWGPGTQVGDKTRRQTVREVKNALAGSWIKTRHKRGYVLIVDGPSQDVVQKSGARSLFQAHAGHPSVVKRPDGQGEPEGKIRERTNRLLELYYDDSSLRDVGLARYMVDVNGQQVKTNIAVSLKGAKFKMNLKQEGKRFKYVEDLSFEVPPFSEDEKAAFIADSSHRGIQARNDPVFCLHYFNPDDRRTSISFSLARYFEYRLSYGKLGDELVTALNKTDFNPEKVMGKSGALLPRRCTLLPNARALANYSKRLCVGGVNVLFALQRRNDFIFFMEERSDKVASARGETCLIPSGFHQPLQETNALQEVAISNSVFRELCEELFKADEVISYDGHPKSDWYFEKFPQIRWFKQNRQKFVHETVCFGLDLIDGSYQFGVLLAVRDPSYWKRYGNDIWTNYEFNHTGASAIIASTKDADRMASILTGSRSSQTSIFTIVSALQRLKQLDSDRVELPKLT